MSLPRAVFHSAIASRVLRIVTTKLKLSSPKENRHKSSPRSGANTIQWVHPAFVIISLINITPDECPRCRSDLLGGAYGGCGRGWLLPRYVLREVVGQGAHGERVRLVSRRFKLPSQTRDAAFECGAVSAMEQQIDGDVHLRTECSGERKTTEKLSSADVGLFTVQYDDGLFIHRPHWC